MAVNDSANIKITRAIVKTGVAGATDLGFIAACNTSGLRLKTIPKEIEALGGIRVDEIIIGLEGTIGIECEELDILVYKELMPWAPASGSIPLTPQLSVASMYALAKRYVIHPEDAAAATTRDITLLKVFPAIKHVDFRGKSKVRLAADLMIFPDQSVITSTGIASYGYLGAEPA